jgi:DnaJ-class molecular chaperone
MAGESCGVCGGDGRIANSFSGSTATCPGCHGTGRRSEDTGLRDVTKTKPSHYRQPNKQRAAETPQGPSSFEGIQLAKEVQASSNISSATKTKLTLEIVEHEATHGKCTQTFIKKVRKQLRAPGS